MVCANKCEHDYLNEKKRSGREPQVKGGGNWREKEQRAMDKTHHQNGIGKGRQIHY